jgi:hypothetical protein
MDEKSFYDGNGRHIDSDIQESAEDTSDVPAAYPLIQPMKAAFHFDSVEGFGEWQILISGRADRDLREAKKSDQKLFRIILKKIKWVFVQTIELHI